MDKNVFCPSCGKAMTWNVRKIELGHLELGHLEGYYTGHFRCDNEECIAGWKTSAIIGTSEKDAFEMAIESTNLRVNAQK